MNAVSVEYSPNGWTLAAEYGQIDFDLIFDSAPPTNWPGESWYVSAAYRVYDWLEFGAYYNNFCVDRHACDGSTHLEHSVPTRAGMYQHDTVMTARFDITRDFVFKVERHVVHGYGLNYLLPSAPSAPDWNMVAVKATYSF